MPSGDVRRQISLRFWSGLAFSVLSGGVFGACCSLAINYALVEVSLSPLLPRRLRASRRALSSAMANGLTR